MNAHEATEMNGFNQTYVRIVRDEMGSQLKATLVYDRYSTRVLVRVYAPRTGWLRHILPWQPVWQEPAGVTREEARRITRPKFCRICDAAIQGVVDHYSAWGKWT